MLPSFSSASRNTSLCVFYVQVWGGVLGLQTDFKDKWKILCRKQRWRSTCFYKNWLSHINWIPQLHMSGPFFVVLRYLFLSGGNGVTEMVKLVGWEPRKSFIYSREVSKLQFKSTKLVLAWLMRIIHVSSNAFFSGFTGEQSEYGFSPFRFLTIVVSSQTFFSGTPEDSVFGFLVISLFLFFLRESHVIWSWSRMSVDDQVRRTCHRYQPPCNPSLSNIFISKKHFTPTQRIRKSPIRRPRKR